MLQNRTAFPFQPPSNRNFAFQPVCQLPFQLASNASNRLPTACYPTPRTPRRLEARHRGPRRAPPGPTGKCPRPPFRTLR
jgi:hypothetical protein